MIINSTTQLTENTMISINNDSLTRYLSNLVNALPEIYNQHSRDSHTYKLINSILEVLIENFISKDQDTNITFDQFGTIKLPYQKMGAITSIDLLGLDELIIFSYYYKNRNRYKNVADLGANIGLHSLVLSKCGYNVTCYEPDPRHFEILKRNLMLNNALNVSPINSAVSDKAGVANFVRVVGNTTSSHLEGSKDNAYGELEKFEVKITDIDTVFKNIDFIKMDVEGAESQIILSTGREHWATAEMLLEVGNEKNAHAIFNHLKKIGINAYSQKNGWSLAKTVEEFPKSYKDGSLFITSQNYMTWLE